MDEDILSVPEVEYSADIWINSKEFSDLISQLIFWLGCILMWRFY